MWILVTLLIPNRLTQGDIMACDEPPERCNQMQGIPCTNKLLSLEILGPYLPLLAYYSYKKKTKQN